TDDFPRIRSGPGRTGDRSHPACEAGDSHRSARRAETGIVAASSRAPHSAHGRDRLWRGAGLRSGGTSRAPPDVARGTRVALPALAGTAEAVSPVSPGRSEVLAHPVPDAPHSAGAAHPGRLNGQSQERSACRFLSGSAAGTNRTSAVTIAVPAQARSMRFY